MTSENRWHLEQQPLHIAAAQGDLDTLKRLCREGADINRQDPSGWTPMHHAIDQHHPNVVRWLIDQGADIERSDCEDWTPLHWAAMKGDTAIVESLLAHGADLTACDECCGDTPLHRAVRFDQLAIARLLVAFGADPEAKNSFSELPWDCASAYGHDALSDYLLEEEIGLMLCPKCWQHITVAWLDRQAIGPAPKRSEFACPGLCGTTLSVIAEEDNCLIAPKQWPDTTLIEDVQRGCKHYLLNLGGFSRADMRRLVLCAGLSIRWSGKSVSKETLALGEAFIEYADTLSTVLFERQYMTRFDEAIASDILEKVRDHVSKD